MRIATAALTVTASPLVFILGFIQNTPLPGNALEFFHVPVNQSITRDYQILPLKSAGKCFAFGTFITVVHQDFQRRAKFLLSLPVPNTEVGQIAASAVLVPPALLGGAEGDELVFPSPISSAGHAPSPQRSREG